MKSANNILQPENRALNIAVLVLDESNTTSFAATIDPMRAANRLAGRPVFDWDYVSATEAAPMLSSGLTVPSFPLAQLQDCEALIVLAGCQLARHATPSLLGGLRRIADTGATVIGVDGGAWLMAEAGLLDDHPAMTHWENLDGFTNRFPQVQVTSERFTLSQGRMTAGGGSHALDLMLHLIGARLGGGFAARMAGLFVEPRSETPEPASNASAARVAPRDSGLTARAQALMESSLDAPLPLAIIADSLGTSPRTLQQQFRLRLNTTPQDHYLQLRLAEARRLVTDTNLPLMEVAEATGFASQSSFARAFRTAHGVSARDLRQQRDHSTTSLLSHGLRRNPNRSQATRH